MLDKYLGGKSRTGHYNVGGSSLGHLLLYVQSITRQTIVFVEI
jgi:hypothetical protein